MIYQHFTSLADAQNYCASQTALMNLPPGGVTTQWSVPIMLADGSYVVPAYQDDNAIPWQSTWILPSNGGM